MAFGEKTPTAGKIPFFFSVCLACLQLQCKNDNVIPEIIPKGRVIDAITNEGVSYATVGLFKSAGNILSSGYLLVAETKTDANGYFEFAPQDGADEVRAVKQNYFDSEMRTVIDNSYKDNPTIKLAPHAFVNLKIKNIYKKFSMISVYASINNLAVSFTGMQVDTIVRGAIISSLNNKIEYSVLGHTPDYEHHLLSLPATPKRLDTIDVQIEY